MTSSPPTLSCSALLASSKQVRIKGMAGGGREEYRRPLKDGQCLHLLVSKAERVFSEFDRRGG